MKKQKSKSLFLLMLIMSMTASSFSREKEKISPYIQLQYFKNTNDQSALQTTLTYSKNRMELPLAGMKVSFFTNTAAKKLLTSVLTDEKGIAVLALNDISEISVNSEGLWSFITEFSGNDSIEAATSELTVRDVQLEMSLSEIDTIKTITLKASAMQNGKQAPVTGELIMIYVPRMFSLLPIAEATLDENGTVSVEFPPDLPGDKDGNIKIIARFEENPTFGNVEKNIINPWGIPTFYSVPKSHRALWTKTPPTWMIVTLSILLAGVWGHYLFAIISLILIKIDAKAKKTQEGNKRY